MDEIIEKILSSSALTLPKGGHSELASIINMMDAFTFEEYKRIAAIYYSRKAFYFSQKPATVIANPVVLANIECFINEWVQILKMLDGHFKKVLTIWKRLDNESMGADYNLPITIKLLPNNPTLLKLFAHKIDELLSIFTGGKISYILTDLQCATQFKLLSTKFKRSHSCPLFFKHDDMIPVRSKSSTNLVNSHASEDIQTRKDTNPDKYETRAQVIKKDLRHFDLVERYFKILSAFKIYADSLEDEIYNKLSTESPDIYAKYSCIAGKKQLVSNVIEELRGNKLISPALNLLIEKQICMLDFQMTLTSKNHPVKYVMNLFAEKYLHFKEIIEGQVNKLNVSLKSVHSYYMLPAYLFQIALPISTAETLFHAEANQLCQYLNKQHSTAAAAAAAITTSLKQ